MSDDPELQELLDQLESDEPPVKKKEPTKEEVDEWIKNVLAALPASSGPPQETSESKKELDELLDSIIASEKKAGTEEETELSGPSESTSPAFDKDEDAVDDSESKIGQVSSAENPPKPATDKEVGVEKVSEVVESNAGPVSSVESSTRPSREKPDVDNPDGKLHHYYEVLVEKVPLEVAHIVVWEGAAKNRKIKTHISDIVDENSYLDENEAGRVAKLFSSQLSSTVRIKKEFLPALRAFATSGWEAIEPVAIYMFGMLLHKLQKRGVTLVTATLPTNVFYRVLGDAVTKISENDNWPKFVVKLPKPDTLLTPEQFTGFLVQDVANISTDETRINWLFILAYSGEDIYEAVVSGLSSEFPWASVLRELSGLMENKDYYDQALVKKAGVRAVRIWGDTTALEERKKTLKELKEIIDHKEFEKALELILSTATFPVEDIQSGSGEPCLLVTCPTIQVAVKLFQHTVKTLGKIDADSAITILVRQGIEDQQLAAVVREMSRLNVIDEELVEDVMYSCSSEGLLQSCAELLRIAPNPRFHPIMEILEEKDEKTCYKALELLSPDLYAPNCSPEDTNALHLAATFGYTTVVKEILARGFYRLLNKPGNPAVMINDIYRQSLRPASIAVQVTHFATASELFQAMEPEEAKMLCTATVDIPNPEINLHKVMGQISSGRGGRWNQKAVDEADWKDTPVRLEKKEIRDRVEFMQTALDTTVDGRRVDLTLLIQDEHGAIPEQFSSSGGGGGEGGVPDPEAARKKAGMTLYGKIARSECEELKSHECFATLTSIIWIDYGIVQGMLFGFYLLFMAFLTTSLVLAARDGNPRQYNTPLDRFRIFCEVVTLLFVFYDLALESYELGSVIYRSLKQNSVCVCIRRQERGTVENENDKQKSAKERKDEDSEEEKEDDKDDDEDGEDDDSEGSLEPEEPRSNPYLQVVKDVISEYFLNWQNMLDDLAIIFVLLIIPFRIADSNNQWVFAALAFMFHGLRIFKYAIMFKSVGEYVAILVLLIKRDVPQFVTVFVVIIFSLGGALYLSLIGYYNGENLDTENNNDTSEIYLLWWTGFRILAEGSALTYYGPGGFNWLGILIYWLFLFIVVVVLLNILIAQFSKSYEEEKERAQINVIITRTEIILRMEQSALTRPCVRIVRKLRARLTRNSVDYQSVERLKGFVGERENEKPASSEQVEELQTQTTNLGLQLRKQIEDNTGKSQLKVEEMKTEIGNLVRETREALQTMKSELDGKFVGLERAVVDTRRYVDDVKELLLSMKDK